MKTLNEDQFKELSNRTGDLVISIYSPTSKQSTDNFQTDKTTFKNVLREIGRELEGLNRFDDTEIKKILQPAFDLLEDMDFWQSNDRSLAFFIIDGEVEEYRLPKELSEPIYLIGKRPFLLPMITELNNDGNFYLLHLDMERLQLFEGTRNSFKEVELDREEIPVSYAEEEANSEFQGIRKRQGSVGGGGEFAAHGEGPGEERKQLVQNYIHRMANKLDKKLNEKPFPLYLAGLDYLIPMFQQASKYPRLKAEHMGRLNGMNINEIHEKAWTLAESHFLEEKNKRREEFGFRASRNLAVAKDHEKLIKAALTGGVDTLLVNTQHQHLWGSFNEEAFSVQFDQGPNGDNHCLVDLAAAKVIDAGGKVYMVPPKEMPDESLVAGTLRYEIP